MATIAIHQPNFIPYYPFFQKMEQCDIFVIISHCQFEKNGYQNRFFTDTWNTMSVNSGLEPIANKRYLKPKEDWDRILKRHHKLAVFNSCISDNLMRTNIHIIESACKILGIKTQIKHDFPTDLSGTERLVNLCKIHGATEYLSGISGKKYLDLDLFKDAGIKVIFQDESKMIKKPLIDFL